ncbi:Cytoskeleton assembly control protein SLA2 [Entamoeba marina]
MVINTRKGVSAEMDINQAIMESAQAIAKATAALVTAAAQAQKERTIIGKKLATPTKPYAPNLIWSEGLVTAGKAVAEATKQIVSVANNNVTPGAEKNEDALIATSHEVAKATAQLVTATRSKADFDSPTLGKVENASNGVMQSTKLLVEAVKAITNMKKEKEGVVDYSKLSDYQLIIKERETQILVLKLRRELEAAESKLKTLNKQKYDRQNN